LVALYVEDDDPTFFLVQTAKVGARAFYTKPATFEVLLDLMRSIFEKERGGLAPLA
jgi:hypothetical protein